ncbi:MAG: hypothetical protein KDD36_07650 [Flavobacteriales bacterium]|nr:hypothetical protein [Flavobacteriales bacterium]
MSAAAAVVWILFMWFMPDSGYDKYFTLSWAHTIIEKGVGHIYDNPEVNYPPLILYLIKFFTLFFPGKENLNMTSINQFKGLVYLFDLGMLILLFHWSKMTLKNWRTILMIWLNPALWYNTVIWGQYDAIPVFFICLASWLAWKGSIIPASLAWTLALNAKLQSIIFLPPLILFIWLYHKPKGRHWLFTALSVAVLQLLLWMPFFLAGTWQEAILAPWQRSIDFYHSASLHAYNIWYLTLPDDPYQTSDTLHFAGMTLRNWGLLFFAGLSACLLWPMIRKRVKDPIDKEPAPETLLLTMALIGFVFFFFNTQMHERYIQASMWLLSGYVLFTRKYVAWLLLSLACLLNLEGVMHYMHYWNVHRFHFDTDVRAWWIFHPTLIAILYLLAGVIMFTSWFRTVYPDQK